MSLAESYRAGEPMYEDPSQPKTQFIEMLGRQLLRVITEGGPSPAELARVGLKEDSIVRINRQGDIELRRPDRWDVIGGLIGDFETRVKQETGLDWV